MLEPIVTPSSQVQSALPQYIAEQYPKFVFFMQRALASSERQGFAQDLLQNLLKYRDFDFYKKPIVETGVLDTYITADETESLKLMDSYGFPETNGIILIDTEIILYDRKEGDLLTGLVRGSSGTKVLGNFIKDPVDKIATKPEEHIKGATVTNLSVLFLSAILKTIHQTYTPGISSDRVHQDVNRGQLLENIKDFFQAKGTKLGIKALFKILFGENDVDVYYPGDQMLTPSKSTWHDNYIIRVVPVPWFFNNPEAINVLPDRLTNRELEVKSFNDLRDPATANKVYGRAVNDYATSYQYLDDTQYEFSIQKNNIEGEFPANPYSTLTREVNPPGSADDRFDVYTITVESTLGFPDEGVLFIDDEAIWYTGKSYNQFYGCTRGYIGIEAYHPIGSKVYGPYFIEAKFTTEETDPLTDITTETLYISRSWPLGLVESVEIHDPGLLHQTDDEVYVNGPGAVDPRDPVIGSFLENYQDELSVQKNISTVADMSALTWGPSSVYFDEGFCFVSSSHLPDFEWGPFSTDGSVGSTMKRYDTVQSSLSVIPRREAIKENIIIKDDETHEYVFSHKGTNAIGIFIDGVPAFSNVSPEKLIQGKIVEYRVLNPGFGYVQPTLLINDALRNEEIEVSPGNGRIISISTNSNVPTNANFTYSRARITSGEGAVLEASFDPYGRVEKVEVIEGGKYYKDVPTISLSDPTRKGKGAVFSVTISRGQIFGVQIVNPGIDYDKNLTTVVVTPQGSGSEIFPVIETFTFDRYHQIKSNVYWNFDDGRGFLWEETDINSQVGGRDMNAYGYIASPTKIKAPEREEGNDHSPLMGWAFDGNPIYGPVGYKNGKDDTDGYSVFASGYVLQTSRDTVIPSGGGTEPGRLPPDIGKYPMGTFVEDYVYAPELVTEKVRIMAESYDLIQTEVPEYILISQEIRPEQVLNAQNAAKVNTPEFPKELYPDGVWCYFMTEVNGEPQFPYIIGKTFQNRPIVQRPSSIDSEEPEAIGYGLVYNPLSVNFEDKIYFDYNVAQRYRNKYLVPTKDELVVEVENCSKGSISEIQTIDGRPGNSRVGDILIYDSEGTGGDGALGIVSLLVGEDVDNAVGADVVTKVISHRQQLILDRTDYTFIVDNIIVASSGAEATVESWDQETGILIVNTYTKKLIQGGDSFKDHKGTWVTLGHVETAFISLADGTPLTVNDSVYLRVEDQAQENYFNFQPSIGRNIYFSYTPPNSEGPTAGDLWWSNQNGRLYIYFNDGDSSQWVCTQPIGIRPLAGALDRSFGNTEDTSYLIANSQEDRVVIIATKAPTFRNDGTFIMTGDLWWSYHTGILYIYNNEWVCTDPNAMAADKHGLNQSNYDFTSIEVPEDQYESQQNIIISYLAPKIDEYTDGTLWWSPLTGKMYIRYTLPSTGWSQWVVTNPVAMLPSKYAYDEIIDGDGGTVDPPIKPLPEPGPDPDEDEDGAVTRRSDIWFEHLIDFKPGDEIQFTQGAPGSSAVEDALLEKILVPGAPAEGRVKRGNPSILLEDGIPCLNTTRSIYTVTTAEPHRLRAGDTVVMENSLYPEVNGPHTIIRAGTILPAEGTTTIDGDGKVTGVTITDPGSSYTQNFYVTFYGNTGTGGYGLVKIDPLTSGVKEVEIIDGGYNYEEPPLIFWGDGLTNKQFLFYTSETYGEDPYVTYSTSSESVISNVYHVDVLSGGLNYQKMPAPLGLMKRESDRGRFITYLKGTSIDKITVMNGGNRYRNPEVLIKDLAGNGTGATGYVEMVDDQIIDIVVTNPGSGYTEPFTFLYETEGAWITLTDDIGKIQSLKVINPGRAISPDKSLKPELMITTRCVVKFDSNIDNSMLTADGLTDFTFISPNGYSDWTVIDPNYGRHAFEDFYPGELVYQGTPEYHQVEAEFVSYDPRTQIVTLRKVEGKLKNNEYLYNLAGERGMIVLEGQADCRCVVNGMARPEGRFVDDTSIISSSYQHLQDSYFYQWFSYTISSPLQQNTYDHFVQNIIHPAGFIMFSDMTIRDEAAYEIETNEVVISGPSYLVLGPDGYGDTPTKKFIIGTHGPGRDNNFLLSPNL